MRKKIILMIGLCIISSLTASSGWAQHPMKDFGQTIEINTNLRSFVGKPTWLLIIRDIDHNQNIPYLYDFTRGTNYWMAFTYGINYIITASELTFNPYDRKIRNFCDLESQGAIQHGTSMNIHISGDLSQNTDTFTCNVLKYSDSDFNIATQE